MPDSAPSDYTVEVSGDIGDDYELDVKGMVPDGGQISSTISGTFSSSRTHEFETKIPDSGEGNVEVVNRSDPVEDGSLGGNSTSPGSKSGSGWGTKEIAAVAGILTLVSLGYYTSSDE